MRKTIAVLGTMDTKGVEHAFVADLIRARGHQVLVIDAGTGCPVGIHAELDSEAVASFGGVDLASLRRKQDRGEAVTAMSKAVAALLKRLVMDRRIDGVISLGGGGGTAIGTAAMRGLPIGFPKVMVSTMASGNVAPYVGDKDIVMIPSIVDISGLNRLSRMILARAAGAICGMVEMEAAVVEGKPLIAASMFGNTTACVSRAREILEKAGYEVMVFSANGTGGRVMEGLIESGLICGVLDVTTTEWADEWVGGVLSAGASRLDAAGLAGVPAVVVPGCLDMVNFGEPDTVPTKYAGRVFYHHNPQVTLMRTSVEECAELGRILAEKVNTYRSPVSVLLPLRGVSAIGAPGGPFHDREADAALFGGIRSHLSSSVTLIEMDNAINDSEFADACAGALVGQLAHSKP